MMYAALGLALGLLVASLIGNGLQWYLRTHDKTIEYWRDRARTAEDSKHAAELRSAEQIDAMLDRLHTTPRLEMGAAARPVNLQEQRYIPDTPDADAAWNEFRGEDDAE